MISNRLVTTIQMKHDTRRQEEKTAKRNLLKRDKTCLKAILEIMDFT